jgi:hypothetical protein
MLSRLEGSWVKISIFEAGRGSPREPVVDAVGAGVARGECLILNPPND